MTTEGFEPSPFQNSALNYRLRPLGQIVIVIFFIKIFTFIYKKIIICNYLINTLLDLYF